MANNPGNKTNCNVYIIGRRSIHNELLSYYLEKSTDRTFKCTIHDSFSTLPVQEEKDGKSLILCNCAEINEHDQKNVCGRHVSSAPEGSSWACLNVPHEQKVAENAISNGVNGVFHEDDSLVSLKRGIDAILNGELWFSRVDLSATLSTLLEKSNISNQQNPDKVYDLTRREKEILKHISLGKTNDEIAGNLNISSLTVKTHVSNIYRKINVPNRIQAIFWVTQNYIHLKD